MTGIMVNGQARALAARTVAELLVAEGIAPGSRFVAVARNGRVVPNRSWSETILAAGDQIEIVRPVRGG